MPCAHVMELVENSAHLRNSERLAKHSWCMAEVGLTALVLPSGAAGTPASDQSTGRGWVRPSGGQRSVM